VIKIGEVARRTGYSVAQVRRWAGQGIIPGTIKPENSRGHFRFREIPALNVWIKKAATKLERRLSRGLLEKRIRHFRRVYKQERNDYGRRRTVLDSAYQLARDYRAQWNDLTPWHKREVLKVLEPIYEDARRF
jgi:hypothetical protein